MAIFNALGGGTVPPTAAFMALLGLGTGFGWQATDTFLDLLPSAVVGALPEQLLDALAAIGPTIGAGPGVSAQHSRGFCIRGGRAVNAEGQLGVLHARGCCCHACVWPLLPGQQHPSEHLPLASTATQPSSHPAVCRARSAHCRASPPSWRC
jgi:hypothetical protein